MTGAARNTITTLLVQLGQACSAYQDRTLRYLTADRIECDEIWSFVHAKAKNVPEEHRGEFGYGDVWTWTAIDPETKLVPSWLVGTRDAEDARAFIADLRSRLMSPRVQITTDGHQPYVAAIEAEFGAEADYAMLIKEYGVESSLDGSPTARRYSPNRVTSQDVRIISGDPDPDLISTAYVERQEPDHADGDAPLHPPDQRVLEEGREPRGHGQPALHVLQLRSPALGAREADHPGDGGGCGGSRLDLR